MTHYNNRQEITVKLINQVSLLNCCWAELRMFLISVIMFKHLVNHYINTDLMETFGTSRKLWLGPGQASRSHSRQPARMLRCDPELFCDAHQPRSGPRPEHPRVTLAEPWSQTQPHRGAVSSLVPARRNQHLLWEGGRAFPGHPSRSCWHSGCCCPTSSTAGNTGTA